MSEMANIFHFQIDIQESKMAASLTFDVISGGKPFITEADLLQLRLEKPEVLRWLNKPE